MRVRVHAQYGTSSHTLKSHIILSKLTGALAESILYMYMYRFNLPPRVAHAQIVTNRIISFKICEIQTTQTCRSCDRGDIMDSRYWNDIFDAMKHRWTYPTAARMSRSRRYRAVSVNCWNSQS